MSGILQRQQFPSTFLLFNYRTAASLWQQRDDDSQAARLDEAASAWIRHSRHFLRSSHYENCVRACVRVCVCAYTSRFVTSVPLLLADLTIYIPPPSLPFPFSFPRTKTETKSPSAVFANEIVTFFERPDHSRSFFFLLLLLLLLPFLRDRCRDILYPLPLEKRFREKGIGPFFFGWNVSILLLYW